MIKRIELINFMSHQHTVIEPSDGLTVLIGPNNCGKSAIVTALQILCNNPRSTYVLRHGAKECKIILETDTGDVVQWSRKKSGSPVYVINGETFDRLKGKVPEQLHAVLRMPQVKVDKESFYVHFGEQTSPLFLLGDKEKAAAQFFASNSDAIRLVEMQDRHKSNIKLRKNDLKRLTREREELEVANTILAVVPLLHGQAIKCERLGSQVAEEKKKLAGLQSAVVNLANAEQRQQLLSKQEETLKTIPALPQLQPVGKISDAVLAIESAQIQSQFACSQMEALAMLESPPQLQETHRLKQWFVQFQSSRRVEGDCESRLAALSDLAQPPEVNQTGGLLTVIKQIDHQQQRLQVLQRRLDAVATLPEVPTLKSTAAMAKLIGDYDALGLKLNQQNDLVKSIEAQISEADDEIGQWVADNPQCPTCGGEITKRQLLEQPGGHVHV